MNAREHPAPVMGDVGPFPFVLHIICLVAQRTNATCRASKVDQSLVDMTDRELLNTVQVVVILRPGVKKGVPVVEERLVDDSHHRMYERKIK